LKVAYIVSLFPKISETFILREMLALRKRGVEIVVVSLKRHREVIMHSETELLLPSTIYASSPERALAALLFRARRQPIVTSRILAHVGIEHLAYSPILLAKSLLLVAVAAHVADLLGEHGVHRVHAHWATYPALVAWAMKRFAGIPYSITAHGHDIVMPNPLLRRKIEESDFMVTCSDYNKLLLAKHYGNKAIAKIHVIRHGVPLEAYAVRKAVPAGPPRIVSVGRLVDYKGFPTLLKAVALLRERGQEVACDIVGEGPLEPLIRSTIDSLRLNGRVRLLGAKTQEEVRKILKGATVCVLACEPGRGGLMDGIPNVLMEAMALGIPAVGTHLSGIPELIEDGRTGLLAEPGDSDSLAVAMDRLISDPALAARVAEEGRQKVEESFDIAHSAAALHNLLLADWTRSLH